MKEIDYREISEAEFKEYYQYFLTRRDGREDPGDPRCLNVLDPYGFYEGDQLRGVIADSIIEGTIRGGKTEFVLCSYGMVPPEYRRSGVLRGALPAFFDSCAERGVPFIIAHEFMSGFYDRFGAPPVSNRAVWECPAGALLSAVDTPHGTFRRLTPDDWRELDDVHREYTNSFSLSIDRTRAHWDWLLKNSSGTPYHIGGWERDGELQGYVVYKFAHSSGKTIIGEIDMGYTDVEAYRHLLYYFGNHDSQADKVVFQGPESGKVFDLVDRSSVECEIRPETILRITDVKVALEAVAYPSDCSGSIVFDVRDSMQAINDGRFELVVEGDSATCTVTEAEPDVTIDVGTLSQLLTGYRTASTLEEVSDLAIHTDRARRKLPRLFPSGVPFVRHEF